jgi:CheY-like chemotaxis protein
MPAQIDAVASRPLSILVVEDNLINQKIIRAFLAPGRHMIDIAANGADALAALEQKAYDLVLMDVQMPVMDGYEATTRIRQREAETGAPRVPIVALTANAFGEDAAHARELGMDAHLSKPYTQAELRALIAQLI